MLEGRNAGTHARDQLIWNAGLFQGKRLFPASAEDGRISALEPHYLQPSSRAVDQQRMDLLLLHFVRILALSHAYQLASLGCFIQKRVVQKIVVHNGLSPAQSLESAHCDQSGLTSCAGYPYFSTHTIPLCCSIKARNASRCAACGLPVRQHLPFRTRVHHLTQ